MTVSYFSVPLSDSKTAALVSVVIPCFRCAHTVNRAVESIWQQTQRPVEVILVDDASGDSTLDVLNKIKNKYGEWIRIVELEKNTGAATARNVGWSIALQPYIAFLDADDTWHPDKLRLQYAFMTAHPRVALSGNLCDEELEVMPVAASYPEQTITTRTISSFQLLFKNAFSTPTVMLRSDTPHRFAHGRRYCEDFLLWQQIAFSGCKVVRLEAPLAQLHKPVYGASGLSGNLWKMEQGELANFLQLRRDGCIGLPTYLVACGFSLLKFARRWAVVFLRE